MVLYCNQWPVNFILHFAELHIGSSIRYEKTLFGNYFLKGYVKRILISFKLRRMRLHCSRSSCNFYCDRTRQNLTETFRRPYGNPTVIVQSSCTQSSRPLHRNCTMSVECPCGFLTIVSRAYDHFGGTHDYLILLFYTGPECHELTNIWIRV